MSQVHDSIALGALLVQADTVKKVFKPHMNDFMKSSWYPDKVNEVKKTKDARFLWPSPPATPWQKKLKRISLQHKSWTWCGQPPLDLVCLCGYYLKNILRNLKAGDIESAVKFFGVYSHLIADIIEPGHAVFDWIIDILAPSSFRKSSGKIYTNKECLRGPVNIKGYRPKLFGENIKQAEMGMVADLIKGSRFGAALAIPMENALYSGKITKARRFSSCAQNEAAKKFADFIYTVFQLADKNKKNSGCRLDICNYPFIYAEISCYCRFRPLVDIFLDPSSFDNTKKPHFILNKLPLTLLSKDDGKIENVHGLCVMPNNIKSRATIEYLLVPGAYDKFSARVGFNPSFKKSLPFISAVFTVLGDGKELVHSKPVKPGEPAVHIHVGLGKTRFLTLSMKYYGRYSGKEEKKFKRYTSAAHGVWAEPVLC